MNKIEEMIEKFCPEGVEYKELGEVCEIKRGRIISKEDIQKVGIYPVYSSQTINNGELGKIFSYDFDGEYITWTTDGANAGTVFYRNEKFNITNVCGLIKIINSFLNTKFVFYYLSLIMKKYVSYGMGNPKLMSNVVQKIKIPIPPIEIQEKIVEILDKFTALTEELKIELTARKKQYEYYRDKLLNFGDEVPKYKLKDIARYENEKVENYKLSSFNYISVENLLKDKLGKKEAESIPKGQSNIYKEKYILLGNIRPYLKKIWFSDCDGGASPDVLNINVFNKIASPKYIYYALSSDNFFFYHNQNSKGGKMPRGNKIAVMNYEISIPPLEKQKEIVEILDKFDSLCNSLTEGLPKEIELRQKQYEYYRDKLLSFKEKIS